MLKLINTKILLAILAVLTAIGAYLIHEHDLHAQEAAAADRTAALLQQQRDADAAAKRHDAETWRAAQEARKKSRSANLNGSHTWTHYLP